MTHHMRPRHYLAPWVLVTARPFFRFSASRNAYVLRVIGGRAGPVLMRDQRRHTSHYQGLDRRGQQSAGVS
jgi:hypothetical protein